VANVEKNSLEKPEIASNQPKKEQFSLEKILRSRVLWLVIIPLILSIVLALIIKPCFSLADSCTYNNNLLVINIIIYFLLGQIMFPMFVLAGIGINPPTQGPNILLIMALIVLLPAYLFFIIKIKKVNKKYLYIISIILILLICLGTRGCLISGING
jgi:hypothetical protein